MGSMFVITLGDVIGIAFWVLLILGVFVWAAYKGIKEYLCKHDFKEARVSRSGSFYIDGYKCEKCGLERIKL